MKFYALLVMSIFIGCTSTSVKSPTDSLKNEYMKLKEGVNKNNPRIIYALLSKEEKNRIGSYENYLALWKENKDYIKDQVSSLKKIKLVAYMELANGDTVVMEWNKNYWELQQSPEIVGGKSPLGIVQMLIAAYESYDLSKVFPLMHPRTKSNIYKEHFKRMALLKEAYNILKARNILNEDDITIEVGNNPRLVLVLVKLGSKWVIKDFYFKH